jgi:hypothetical protein
MCVYVYLGPRPGCACVCVGRCVSAKANLSLVVGWVGVKILFNSCLLFVVVRFPAKITTFKRLLSLSEKSQTLMRFTVRNPKL